MLLFIFVIIFFAYSKKLGKCGGPICLAEEFVPYEHRLKS